MAANRRSMGGTLFDSRHRLAVTAVTLAVCVVYKNLVMLELIHT